MKINNNPWGKEGGGGSFVKKDARAIHWQEREILSIVLYKSTS